MNRRFTIFFAVLCTVLFVGIVIVFAPRAEEFWVVPVMCALYFPVLPITAIVESIGLIGKTGKQSIERIGLSLDILGSILMGGFWLFMVLRGGNSNLPMALTVIGINVVITVLLGIKLHLEG